MTNQATETGFNYVKYLTDLGIKVDETTAKLLNMNQAMAQAGGGGTGKKTYWIGGKQYASTSEAGYREALSSQITAGKSKASGKKKKDFIMRPGQGAVEFSSDDTIVGMKNLNGMKGITLIIKDNNIYGTNPDDISNAILNKLVMRL